MPDLDAQTPLDPKKPADNKKVIDGFLIVQDSNDPYLQSLRVDVSSDPTTWNKADLKTLATTKGGVPAFDALVFLSEHAVKLVNGKPTAKASEALEILKQYRPATAKGFFAQLLSDDSETSVDAFIKDIKAIDHATRNHPVRAQMHRSSESQPAPKLLPTKIKVGAVESDNIKFSDDQNIKTPQFDETALAAVKGKKSSNSIS